MDEQMCDECEGKLCFSRYAPYFCGDVNCLQVCTFDFLISIYYCHAHSDPYMQEVLEIYNYICLYTNLNMVMYNRC